MSCFDISNNFLYRDTIPYGCVPYAVPQRPYINTCFCPKYTYPAAGAYYGSNLGLYITPNSFPYNNTNNIWQNNSYLNNPFNNRFLQQNNLYNPFLDSTGFFDTVDSKRTTSVKKSSLSEEKRISILKEYLKQVEGGYAIVKGDRGGATKHGVTHGTYDDYRRRKHLPTRSVKEMTEDEFTEIIEYFWKNSGANKVDDPRLAFYVFSTDWMSGIGKSKEFLAKCNGDPEKFEQLRRNFYNGIAVGDQARFKKGWQNRVTRDHNFADSKFC